MKKFIAFLLVLMTAFVFIGCNKDDKVEFELHPVIANDNIDPNNVAVGNQFKIDAGLKVISGELENKKWTWESSNKEVAEITANGVFNAKASGTVTITVTSEYNSKVKGTIVITISGGDEVLPTKLTIALEDNKVSKLIKDRPYNLVATIEPETIDNEKYLVVYEVIGGQESEINGNSVIPSHVGTCAVRAYFTDTDGNKVKVDGEILYSNTLNLTVVEKEIPVTQVQLLGANEFLSNAKFKIGTTYIPIDATNTGVVWSFAEETELATIDPETGVITPKDITTEGKIKVRATLAADETIYTDKEITIIKAVAPEDWNVSTNLVGSFSVNSKISVIVDTTTEHGDTRAEYTSSDESIATVVDGTITAIKTGKVTITVKSVANPALVQTIELEVTAKIEETGEFESVTINGENKVYVGYTLQLGSNVRPASFNQNVTWEIRQGSEFATIDNKGLLTAIAKGTVRVRCTTVEGNHNSSTFTVTVEEEPVFTLPNLGGYTIKFMNAASALGDIDPFHTNYTSLDKKYKQEAWREVETEANCKIVVEPYPDDAGWGSPRIEWIKKNAANNDAQADLFTIACSWLSDFVKNKAAANVINYYGKYGKNQMTNTLKQAATYQNGLYAASTGTNKTSTYVNLGLFYNCKWLEQLNVENPAKMFNEGRWTYTNFVAWVKNVQSLLKEGEHVLGGHSLYYWTGLSNAAGIKIADTLTPNEKGLTLSSQKQKDAVKMMRELVEAGCYDCEETWAEGSGNFVSEKTLISTGFLWFCRAENRWTPTQFGTDTRYGYVPYPYPDDMKKEDTRIIQDGPVLYMYAAGREKYYNEKVTLEGVYQVVNEMFLRTIQKQEQDPQFDAEAIKKQTLEARISDPESITAILYFDQTKAFYDASLSMFSSIAASTIKTACVYTIRDGKDYDESFDAIKNATLKVLIDTFA